MDAFENHREERIIANNIKKAFDKEYSKLLAYILKLFSRVMELRSGQKLRKPHRPPDTLLHVCHF